MQFRIVGERGLSETIPLVKVFLSGLTLKEFLNAILRVNPKEEYYNFELIDSSNKILGSEANTESLAERVLKVLSSEQSAVEMRSSLDKIREIGTEALSIIDRQLDMG